MERLVLNMDYLVKLFLQKKQKKIVMRVGSTIEAFMGTLWG